MDFRTSGSVPKFKGILIEEIPTKIEVQNFKEILIKEITNKVDTKGIKSRKFSFKTRKFYIKIIFKNPLKSFENHFILRKYVLSQRNDSEIDFTHSRVFLPYL